MSPPHAPHVGHAWRFMQEFGCWRIEATPGSGSGGDGGASIEIAPRPAWCDRGNWLATLDTCQAPGLGGGVGGSIDAHDGWPRYYFDLAVAQRECEAWLRRRNFLPATPHAVRRHSRVTDVFAYVTTGPEGEFVPSFMLGQVWMPLLGFDVDRMESLQPQAEAIAAFTGKSLVLARFTERADVGSISAHQAAFNEFVAPGGTRNGR